MSEPSGVATTVCPICGLTAGCFDEPRRRPDCPERRLPTGEAPEGRLAEWLERAEEMATVPFTLELCRSLVKRIAELETDRRRLDWIIKGIDVPWGLGGKHNCRKCEEYQAWNS